MKSVALIGPDGAGKSTIAQEVARAVSVPARYLYMGVNLDSSNHALPTTRLAMALKLTRGRRRRMTANWSSNDSERRGRSGVLTDSYSAVRLLLWLSEEWYRAILAMIYIRRGFLIVYDRHFVYDYYASHVVRRPGRTLPARIHGELLRRYYPRPDFVVYLDAPASVLHARKSEQSVEYLDLKRREYLASSRLAPDFAVVNAAQPLPGVVAEVTRLLEARLR